MVTSQAAEKGPFRKYEVNRAVSHIKYILRTQVATLPLYSSRFSRKDFTLHQLCAILTLKKYLHVDYRRIVTILKIYPEFRKALGIQKVPHYSTLAHAHKRITDKTWTRTFWLD